MRRMTLNGLKSRRAEAQLDLRLCKQTKGSSYVKYLCVKIRDL